MQTLQLAEMQASLVSAMANMIAIKTEQATQVAIANMSSPAPAMTRTFKYKGSAL